MSNIKDPCIEFDNEIVYRTSTINENTGKWDILILQGYIHFDLFGFSVLDVLEVFDTWVHGLWTEGSSMWTRATDDPGGDTGTIAYRFSLLKKREDTDWDSLYEIPDPRRDPNDDLRLPLVFEERIHALVWGCLEFVELEHRLASEEKARRTLVMKQLDSILETKTLDVVKQALEDWRQGDKTRSYDDDLIVAAMARLGSRAMH